MSKEAKIMIGIGIVFLVVFVGLIMFIKKSNTTSSGSADARIDEKLLVTEGSYKISTSSAKVTVVEFLDFECEACGAAHPVVKQILEEYEGKIQFVVRNFPNHRNSLLAANAAYAAGEQGKFWEMHDKLFENQKEWGEKQTPQTGLFLKYAQELGLDTEKIKDAMENNTFSERINKDKTEGIELGVNATPTFYINGIQEVGVLSYDQFKQKIDAELAK